MSITKASPRDEAEQTAPPPAPLAEIEVLRVERFPLHRDPYSKDSLGTVVGKMIDEMVKEGGVRTFKLTIPHEGD